MQSPHLALPHHGPTHDAQKSDVDLWEQTNEHEQALLERIRAGDHAAFTTAVHTYYAGLCDFAWRYVRSTTIAEEVVQEAFLKLWEQRQHLKSDGSLRAYLYRAVKNRSLNHLRDQRTRTQKTEALAEYLTHALSPADKAMLQEELAHRIREALDALPERRRTIFVLSKLHGLTHAEIASVLGISINTVDTQMRRALSLLRERLASYVP